MLRPLLLLLLVLSMAVPATAADPSPLPAPIGDGGQAYLDAIRGSRISADAAYYDPDGPAPALRTDVEVAAQAPAAEPEGDAVALDIGPWTVGLLFAALLAVVLLLAVRFGGVHAVSFERTPERGARARTRRKAAGGSVPVEDPGPDSLEEIARMADRERALHLLLERSLAHAASANGQRIGRSQTARDVIRGLPQAWPLLPSLRIVAAEAEVVQFGGRDLTDETFRACVDAARPIFGVAAAPAGS